MAAIVQPIHGSHITSEANKNLVKVSDSFVKSSDFLVKFSDTLSVQPRNFAKRHEYRFAPIRGSSSRKSRRDACAPTVSRRFA